MVCEFCHNPKHQILSLCDYPTGGPCKKCLGSGEHVDGRMIYSARLQRKARVCPECVGQGKQRCNRRFCNHCGANISKEEGYCPDHLARAGKTKPLVREQCYWLAEAKYPGRCRHQGCDVTVQQGDQCLYFPEKRRVMCEECGEEYLRITEPTT